MDNIELTKILSQHALWISDNKQGARANLQGANLRGANLQGADLQGADLREANLRANLQGADLREANLLWANLQGANLQRADLRGADLQGADLREANLLWANLQGANLQRADLRGADLQGANLRGANLQGADLQGADLREANLQGANLQGADLQGADLREANLQGANLRGADLSKTRGLGQFIRVPKSGSIIGYKQAAGCIITLLIPESSQRINCIGSLKCRCDRAKVISIKLIKTGDLIKNPVSSDRDPKFIYTSGKWVKESEYDPSDRVECSEGIHFFMTEQEALEY